MNVAYSEEFNLYADHFAFFERDYNSRSNEVLKEKPCLGRIEFRFFILCTPAETERQGRRNREAGGGRSTPPDFGKSVNPITSRPADYALHVTP